MKSIFISAIALFVFAGCAHTQTPAKIFAGSTKPGPNEGVATFSEGCFWHAEIIFQSLAGVRDAVSGYAGGNSTKPTYENVSTGKTGHAETVQVYYDTTKISFATLVDALFASMDPTQANGQGNDMGTEYRSIAFYRNANEKSVIDAAIKKLTDSKKYKDRIATQVLPFSVFYPAEQYHQEYIYNNPDNGYVQNVSIPEYNEFRKSFKGPFKK